MCELKLNLQEEALRRQREQEEAQRRQKEEEERQAQEEALRRLEERRREEDERKKREEFLRKQVSPTIYIFYHLVHRPKLFLNDGGPLNRRSIESRKNMKH